MSQEIRSHTHTCTIITLYMYGMVASLGLNDAIHPPSNASVSSSGVARGVEGRPGIKDLEIVVSL